jgi:hypothetical protein
MKPDEKARLLALFAYPGNWCRDAEARNAYGDSVTYDNETAVSWDLTGALCRLFGWHRACLLFGQVGRHVVGKHALGRRPRADSGIHAMRVLQDFNDQADITFDTLRERINTIPVSRRGSRADGPATGGPEAGG